MRIQVTLKSLLLAVSFALMASLAQAQKTPVTVGFLPKLDTDPYFQVAKTGA